MLMTQAAVESSSPRDEEPGVWGGMGGEGCCKRLGRGGGSAQQCPAVQQYGETAAALAGGGAQPCAQPCHGLLLKPELLLPVRQVAWSCVDPHPGEALRDQTCNMQDCPSLALPLPLLLPMPLPLLLPLHLHLLLLLPLLLPYASLPHFAPAPAPALAVSCL